jgi:hypothetical protein
MNDIIEYAILVLIIVIAIIYISIILYYIINKKMHKNTDDINTDDINTDDINTDTNIKDTLPKVGDAEKYKKPSQPHTKQPHTKQPHTKQTKAKQPHTKQTPAKQPHTKQPQIQKPQLIKVLKSISKTGKVENMKLPHTDEYQKILESDIDKSLSEYKINKDSYSAMIDYIDNKIKYKRRCLPVNIKNGKITFLAPNPKANIWGRDGVDNRVFTFIRMIHDMDKWCSKHNLMLPECEFIIYVADTYAWEETAKDLPWFIMAKPMNRPGILIPDNSFITHGESGELGLTYLKNNTKWIWDTILKKSELLTDTDKIDTLYFKGANTGTFKFSTREFLSKYKWDIPVKIVLGDKHESMFSWNKYSGVLNLPGNQPWSYRLKYLYLLKSPVVNVDVLLRYNKLDDSNDKLDRWIQFFDPLFIPNEDYIQVSQIYYDNPKLPDFKELRQISYDKVVDDIKKSYNIISNISKNNNKKDKNNEKNRKNTDTKDKNNDETNNTYANRAYEKISNLSVSRILQFLYVTIVKYSIASDK